MIRLCSSMSGLRIANQYDLTLFSLLEDSSGNNLANLLLGKSLIINKMIQRI